MHILRRTQAVVVQVYNAIQILHGPKSLRVSFMEISKYAFSIRRRRMARPQIPRSCRGM